MAGRSSAAFPNLSWGTCSGCSRTEAPRSGLGAVPPGEIGRAAFLSAPVTASACGSLTLAGGFSLTAADKQLVAQPGCRKLLRECGRWRGLPVMSMQNFRNAAAGSSFSLSLFQSTRWRFLFIDLKQQEQLAHGRRFVHLDIFAYKKKKKRETKQ